MEILFVTIIILLYFVSWLFVSPLPWLQGMKQIIFLKDKSLMTAANLSWLCLIKLSNASQQCPTHVTLPKSIQFIIWNRLYFFSCFCGSSQPMPRCTVGATLRDWQSKTTTSSIPMALFCISRTHRILKKDRVTTRQRYSTSSVNGLQLPCKAD